MKTFVLGPFLAALAMFIWGFFYYGLSGFPYAVLGSAPEAGPALNRLFPASGTYVFPDPRVDPKVVEKQFASGPIATVHIHKEGANPMDPLLLIKGFALEFVSCVLLALLLTQSAAKGYAGRVCFAVLAGVLITLFSNGGQVIWWRQDWAWHTRTMIHDIAAWLAAGLILAIFVRRCEPRAPSPVEPKEAG